MDLKKLFSKTRSLLLLLLLLYYYLVFISLQFLVLKYVSFR